MRINNKTKSFIFNLFSPLLAGFCFSSAVRLIIYCFSAAKYFILPFGFLLLYLCFINLKQDILNMKYWFNNNKE